MESTELRLRHQLGAFAIFTSHALGQTDVNTVMAEACLRGRAGLEMSHAKLLEYLPHRDRMLLCAGVGWQEGYVGSYEIPLALDTPIGHAFAFSEPVAIGDYMEAQRFVYPSILKAHGCVASVNVPVYANGQPWGILEVDHITSRTFSADDIAFLTAMGNAIGGAIELHRLFERTKALADEKAMLVREMNHRTKNNLTLVSSLLRIRARSVTADARTELEEAALRVSNLALVHDRLQLFASSCDRVPAAEHLRELAIMLQSLFPPGVSIEVSASGSINGRDVEALTLIANELVSNAAKYAFPDGQKGLVTIGFKEEGAGWTLWVRDDGKGIGKGADDKTQKHFGHQLIKMLTRRLDAQFTITEDGGTLAEITKGSGCSTSSPASAAS